MSGKGLGSAANRLVATLLLLGGRLYGSKDNTRGNEVNMLRNLLRKTVLVCTNMDISGIDVIISAERSVEQRLELSRSRCEAQPAFALGGSDGTGRHARFNQPRLHAVDRLIARSEEINNLVSRVVVTVVGRLWVRPIIIIRLLSA